MNRRTFLLSLAAPVSAALLFAACGDDSSGDRPDVDGTDAPTTVPPTTVPTATTIAHPAGAQDVVLRLATEGGFVPADFIFTRLPQVLVTGDGSVYTQGAQIEIYPQPLLPPVLVGRISEERLQALLQAASDANLLRDVTYGDPDNGIADAPDTVLVVSAGGRTYTHRAYALGMGDMEKDPDRKAFSDYTVLLDQLATEDLGSTPYRPTQFAIRALPADLTPSTDVVPDEVAWPADSGVALAAAGECKVVEASAVGATLAAATQITRFVDGDVQYVLLVRPLLPGDPGC